MGAFAWEVKAVDHVDEFLERMLVPFELASASGVELLVLPESLVLEAASAYPALQGAELISALAELESAFVSRARDLARHHRQNVVAGSHFSRQGQRIHNVSLALIGDKEILQPKNVMTQFESVEWGFGGASSLFPYAIQENLACTLVCYDCEFPEAGRAACETGSLLLIVPAFTETRRGFQRVRWSCHARAVENQVFVVHASLVGGLGREPVPSTCGSSAILCPCVEPFPESSVLAETPIGEPGLAVADLDFNTLLSSREQDDVRNWHDRKASTWSIEPGP